jgi:hypothetical protein
MSNGLGLIIGMIIGTIAGYALCSLMVVSKKDNSAKRENDCYPKKCTPYSCKAWNICDHKWSQSFNFDIGGNERE